MLLTFLDELAAGVLDARRAGLAAATGVGAIASITLGLARGAETVKRVRHGDETVDDLRGARRHLGRGDAQQAGRRRRVHVHVQVVHPDAARLR